MFDVSGGNVAGTAYGSRLGIWIFVDYTSTTAIDSIALGNAVEIPKCDPANLNSIASLAGTTDWDPSIPNTFTRSVGARSADRCYWIPQQKSTDAFRRHQVTVVTGSTDPATTNDPVTYYDDVQFISYDGQLYMGAVDPSGTDVGQASSDVTINFS